MPAALRPVALAILVLPTPPLPLIAILLNGVIDTPLTVELRAGPAFPAPMCIAPP